MRGAATKSVAEHRRGAATTQAAPRRRNPPGAWVLWPYTASLVVDDQTRSTSSPLLVSRPQAPRARPLPIPGLIWIDPVKCASGFRLRISDVRRFRTAGHRDLPATVDPSDMRGLVTTGHRSVRELPRSSDVRGGLAPAALSPVEGSPRTVAAMTRCPQVSV